MFRVHRLVLWLLFSQHGFVKHLLMQCLDFVPGLRSLFHVTVSLRVDKSLDH